jgi:hypothetical protein
VKASSSWKQRVNNRFAIFLEKLCNISALDLMLSEVNHHIGQILLILHFKRITI